MPAPIGPALGVLLAYLLGSLPWALWVGQLVRGIDVREHGSRNLGATNVYRLLGPGLGLTVFALDMAKGAAAVLAARGLGGAAFPGGAEGAGLAGAVAAVLGHVFPAFAGFRGGRGVATAAGAMLAVAPRASGLALGVFALTLALSRRVSVGSVSAALAFIVFLWLLAPGRHGAGASATALVGSAVALLVVVRHVPNLRRLARGEEPALHFRSDGLEGGSGPASQGPNGHGGGEPAP